MARFIWRKTFGAECLYIPFAWLVLFCHLAQNKNAITPLYEPNSKVYAYLKDGLQICTIDYIVAIISHDGTNLSYYLKEGGRESYNENQLLPSIQHAKKRLEENSNQLQLAIG